MSHVIATSLLRISLISRIIAEYLGVSQQTYSNYENGHREIPIWAVTKLSEYYKVSTDYLLSANSEYLGNTNFYTYIIRKDTLVQ